MIINFKVNGDTIKTSEKETFYTGNVNSYICEFEFSEDWDKAAAFCVMTNGKKSAVLYIADSKCTVPSEILSGKGTVKLGLYGTDSNKRISTNCVMLKVREGAYEIGEDDMTMPIPDVWEQLVAKTVPKIGDNGNWLVWSMTENKYVDTGIYATVDIGEFYKKSETDEKLSGKVDKVTGKGLSTNDYTDEEKEKLKGLSNYDDTEIKNEIGGKVDKVQGKGLSSNDYTVEEKTKLSELPTKTELNDELVKKLNVDEAVGKKTEQGGEVFNGYMSNNTASGPNSHAEGDRTIANGERSHAEGYATIASGKCQHVQGKHNKEDTENKYAHIVGNGTSNGHRSNAHTLDWDGNAWYQGDIRIGGTSYDDGKTLETKTTITTSTETSPSITLADNTEFIFTAELEELEIALPQNATEPYICSVVFNSGETPTGVVYTTGSIYFKGINCTGSTFTPTANKHYTLMFVYDSMELICYVSAKPINEIILFSTADTDEASVMSDESYLR